MDRKRVFLEPSRSNNAILSDEIDSAQKGETERRLVAGNVFPIFVVFFLKNDFGIAYSRVKDPLFSF